ncbi:ABC transporter permease [Rhodoferax sp.]|uniref:MlaE family ABC transporter permease n=1 Tax=Rhodoferax sp. TaxID=50421 RepID=UPI001EC011E4|nr:ABC transporter permease [Rhodoferax sp.]MBT9505943.1 ABC transporter permease [Rhodoferax sp.]
MSTRSSLHLVPAVWSTALLRGIASWWHMLRFGAMVLVIGLSPSTYNRANRATSSKYIYVSTWQVLPWFTAMTTLLSLVLIRIVVVTALSYGLSQYALEMVVRVLVLELIPLSAAMFVALRAGLTFSAASTGSAHAVDMPSLSLTHMRNELMPRVMASAFSVITLALVSSVIALVLAYLTVYGLSPWGLPGYTRTVGHVFDLAVTLGFGLKTIFFSMAVAVVPMAASLEARPVTSADAVQPGAVRLFLVLLLIEAASLVVKYI